jgi:prepilin-type N-terminal cleavage/methylation domain-containing protein
VRAASEPAGFTLIELMIVIAIIAIIAAIAIPNLLAAKLSANETAAIATLRSLVSSQAQVSVAGRIDVDLDGRGEYGTFMELTGAIGVRKNYTPGSPASSDFSPPLGNPINPALLSSVMARMDVNGFATKSGYAYMIFLPDTADPAEFVHETGPVGAQNFAGGTALVGVDVAENYWCAYAQPVAVANTGNRRFFTSMKGDILQSPNDISPQGGTAAPIQGNSAFLGTGITSAQALGAVGQDGNTWKTVN